MYYLEKNPTLINPSVEQFRPTNVRSRLGPLEPQLTIIVIDIQLVRPSAPPITNKSFPQIGQMEGRTYSQDMRQAPGQDNLRTVLGLS